MTPSDDSVQVSPSFTMCKESPLMIPSSAPCRRYSSPPPPEDAGPCGGKAYCSPPPPPHRVNKSRRGPAAESVLSEINGGRSILNPKPADICQMNLSRETLLEELGCESEKNGISVFPRLNCGMILVSPGSSHFGSPLSASDMIDDEELEEDMPSMPSPIRLPMRCTPARTSLIAPRAPGRFPGGRASFRPINDRNNA